MRALKAIAHGVSHALDVHRECEGRLGIKLCAKLGLAAGKLRYWSTQ